MAQDRDWATVYVRDEFGDLLADLGLTDSTVDDWLAGVLDSTFRGLSVAESDMPEATATDAQVPNALLLLDYYTVRKGLRALNSTRVDTKTEAGLERKRSQAVDHWEKEFTRIEKAAVGAGLIAGDGAVTFGRLGLDFLEPALAEWG